VTGAGEQRSAPAVGYLCHECGTPLSAVLGSRMMWCRRCKRDRRVPTDPRLIVGRRREQAG
jgi:DNA-directed RNA polymerase subunit RPC12/RpoP